MNKRLILFITIILATTFSLSSCGNPDNIYDNVDNQELLTNNVIGQDALIEIGNRLFYDSTTRIVYWWNGNMGLHSYSATNPTPYYAPNGLPYRYNPETNSFEEIER